jgi:hypothetical protein
MSPCLLLPPAKRGFDLAITTVGSVAYNKIIANALPMLALPVPFVKYGRIAISGG